MKTILFATDFTDPSAAGEALALELAKCFEAEVTILHAIERIPLPPGDHSFDALYRSLEKKADAAIARITQRFAAEGVRTKPSVVVDARWRAIVNASQAINADLTIIGSRGFDPGTGEPLGSTSHKVFMMMKRPLLIAR